MKKLYLLASVLFSISIICKVQAACNLAVSISPTTTTINVGASTGTLTALAVNNTGAVTYGWAPCSTLNSSTGASVIATPAGSTTYTVTAFDASGCIATATTVVNVIDPSVPNLAPTTVSGGYTGANFVNTYANVSPTNIIQTGDITNTNYPGESFASFTNGSGFTFTFNGINYSSFGLNTNGYIWFTQNGATPLASATDPLSNASANLGGSGTIDGIISAMGTYVSADVDYPTVTPSIGVLITGAAPNRICTIQWEGYSPVSVAGCCVNIAGDQNDNRVDFQILLNENGGANSGEIELNYSNETPLCIDAAWSVEVGLRGTSNTDYNNRSASSGNWKNSVAGGSNAAVCSTTGSCFSGTWVKSPAFTFAPSCAATRTTITPSVSTNLCPAGSVDLTASAGTNYQWYLNGTLTGTTSQTFSGITTAGNYVAVSSSGGCGIPSYVTAVTTNAAVTPSINITSNPTPLCGSNATFTATPTNGGCVPSYQWQLNGVPVSNMSLSATSYTNNSLNANDQIQVVMTSNALCASPTAVTSNAITNSPLAVTPIGGGASKVCLNSSTAAFTDATAGGTWSITAGTGTASITAGGIATGLTAGTVTVVYSYNNGTCTGTATTPLTVNALPAIASITGTPNVCTNSTTQLSDITTGGIWSSDSTSTATVNPSTGLVTAVAVGNSVITYTTAPDGNGCIASASKAIAVNLTPTPGSSSNSPVCSGTALNLSSSGGTGYSWTGPNSFTSSQQNPVISNVPVANGGTYTVTVTAGNACSATATSAVSINLSPTANPSSNSPLCSGNALNLSSGGGTSYSWTGPNSFTSSQQNPVIPNAVVANGGTYTVTVTAANACTSSATTPVTVNPPPTASASSNSPVCSGNALNLSSGGGTVYSWTGPNSFSSSQQNPLVTNVPVANGGTYTVTVTVGGGCSATATTAVSVNLSPTANASANSPLCSGDPLNLTSGGGAGYSWTGPNSFTSSQQNPVISNTVIANGGTYTVTVTAANTCTSSSSTAVNINPLPIVNAGSNSPICYGDSLILFSGGGTSYSWTGPNSFTSTDQNPIKPIAISPDSGNYIVTVTSASSCIATASFNAIVYPPMAPPSITQSGDTLKCGTDPSYTSYEWFDSTAIINGAIDTFIVITHNGNYNVQVGNGNGCKVAVGITVTFTGIQIPLGAGVNDNLVSLIPNPVSNLLTIHASVLHQNEKITVSVINVLGELMLEQKIKWKGDGSINVESLSEGIYFLLMESESSRIIKKFVKE